MCQHCNPNAQVVEAESVADYLNRYYKPDRIAAVGFEVLKRAYEIELEVYGFVVTSHYDNVTGGLIAWPRFEEWTERMQEQVERERELREKDPIINPSAFGRGVDESKVRTRTRAPRTLRQAQVQTAPAVDPFD